MRRRRVSTTPRCRRGAAGGWRRVPRARRSGGPGRVGWRRTGRRGTRTCRHRPTAANCSGSPTSARRHCLCSASANSSTRFGVETMRGLVDDHRRAGREGVAVIGWPGRGGARRGACRSCPRRRRCRSRGPRPPRRTGRHRTRCGPQRGAGPRQVAARWSCRSRPGRRPAPAAGCPRPRRRPRAGGRSTPAARSRACSPGRFPGRFRVGSGSLGEGPGRPRRRPRCAARRRSSRRLASWATMSGVVRARCIADSVTGRPSRRSGTPPGSGGTGPRAVPARPVRASPSIDLGERSCAGGRAWSGIAAASSRVISAGRHVDWRSLSASTARAMTWWTVVRVERHGVGPVDRVRPTSVSGSIPSPTRRPVHSSCKRRGVRADLEGRLSMTASRSSRHRSRGVGVRLEASRRTARSCARCGRRTSRVRAENSASTSGAMSAISAMPFSGVLPPHAEALR